MPIILDHRQDGLSDFHLYYGIPRRKNSLSNYSPEFKSMMIKDRKPIYGEIVKAVNKLFHDGKLTFSNKWFAFPSKQGYPNFYGKFKQNKVTGDRLLDLNFALWALRIANVRPLGIPTQNYQWDDLLLSYGLSPTPGVSRSGYFVEEGFKSTLHSFPSITPRLADLMYNAATDYMITFGIEAPINAKISIIIYGQSRLSQADRDRMRKSYGKKFQTHTVYTLTGSHIYTVAQWVKFLQYEFGDKSSRPDSFDDFIQFSRSVKNQYMYAAFDNSGAFRPWFYEGYLHDSKRGILTQADLINDFKSIMYLFSAVINAIHPLKGSWEEF